MGFFKAMGRVMSGKPVFDETDGMAQTHSSVAATTPHVGGEEQNGEHDGIIKNNPGTFPVVRIERFKTYHDGHDMEITAEIKNEWHFQVIVQTVRAFGANRSLGVWIRPEQTHEIVIYKGPVFDHQPNGEVILDYKTEHEGDYFEAIHDTRFLYTANKTYDVSAISLRLPIRDIYG